MAIYRNRVGGRGANARGLRSILLALALTIVFAAAAAGASGAALAQADAGAKNVILFIGDGMGYNHAQAGWNLSAASGRDFAVDSMPISSSVTTLSYGGNITDSAAASTAMATGHKTVNRSLGIDPDGAPVKTILEAVRDAGGRTGIVSTCAVTDATPAGFTVHVEDRGSGREIAAAMVHTGPDLILGGGAAHFVPTLFEKTKPPLDLAVERGYSILRDPHDLEMAESLPVLGMFALTSMDFEADRNRAEQPSLSRMTERAIELLSAGCGERGFFLMVEGGRIDHTSHNNDAERLPLEVLAFDQAVQVGLEFARQRGDTLVIVTADHETGRVELSADGTVKFGSDDHTELRVPLHAEGPCQDLFAHDVIDNTDIAKLIASAMGVSLDGPVSAAMPMEDAPPASGAPAAAGSSRPVLGGVEPKRITVMTYNIHAGTGADLVYNLDRIAELIRTEGADIVGLNEVDSCTTRSGSVDQAKYIADKLGFYCAYGAAIAYKGGLFGNAILSRYPIISSRNHMLPNPKLNEQRAALECQVDVHGTTVNVLTTHLDVQEPSTRLAQATRLTEIASSLQGPTIITGDFNAIPMRSPETAVVMRQFNDTMQVYRMLLDSRELAKDGPFGRDYLKGGYTYDAYDPNRRIDYIFASRDLAVVGEAGAARVPRTMASDHLPYIATLELPWNPPDEKARPLVVVMSSPDTASWFADMGWLYDDDIEEIFTVVGEMGYDCVEATPDVMHLLPYAAGSRPTVLLISNARRMSLEQQQAVREFVMAGGRVLATYQTSLKTVDEALGGISGFGLADLFGVGFAGWLGVTPLHDAIAPVAAGAGPAVEMGKRLWKSVDVPMALEIPEGAIVNTRPGALVLGGWTDGQGVPTHRDDANAAVVLNGRTMYVGCDLLCWDMLQDEQVKTFVRNAIDLLLTVE